MGVPETVHFTDFLTIAQRVCIPFKNDCHAPNSKVETVQLQVTFFRSFEILIIIYTIFVNSNLPHTQGGKWLFRDTLVGHVIWGIHSRKKIGGHSHRPLEDPLTGATHSGKKRQQHLRPCMCQQLRVSPFSMEASKLLRLLPTNHARTFPKQSRNKTDIPMAPRARDHDR